MAIKRRRPPPPHAVEEAYVRQGQITGFTPQDVPEELKSVGGPKPLYGGATPRAEVLDALGVPATLKQQRRNIVDYMTAACDASLHGTSTPSLLPIASVTA